MTPKHFIYRIVDEKLSNGTIYQILIKVIEQEVYEGFDSYQAAENWIIKSGKRQVDYTILPTYRHP